MLKKVGSSGLVPVPLGGSGVVSFKGIAFREAKAIFSGAENCTLKTEQRKVISKYFRVTTTIFNRRGKLKEPKGFKHLRSSYKERKGNALAPGADEGRSDLR